MAKAQHRSPSSNEYLYMIYNMLLRETTPEKDCQMDVSELAKVFQALKFRIRSSGLSAPSIAEETGAEETAGIRITVTCLKSRKQLVLVRDAHDCSCAQVDEDKGSWEVTAMSGSRSSLVETACGLYPQLHADATLAVRRLMAYVGALAAGRIDPPPGAASATPKWRERRSDGWHRLSLGASEERPGGLIDFASRYRSLDTLIDKDDSVPKPGVLLKPASNSCFDANNRAVSDSKITPSPRSPAVQVPISPALAARGQVYSHLCAAQENLAKAIALYSGDGVPNSVERRPTKSPRIGNARSCPKLDTPLPAPTMPPPKSNELPRARIVKRPETTTVLPATSAPSGARTGATRKSAATQGKNKYAHVKSTIPKPAPRHY